MFLKSFSAKQVFIISYASRCSSSFLQYFRVVEKGCMHYSVVWCRRISYSVQRFGGELADGSPRPYKINLSSTISVVLVCLHCALMRYQRYQVFAVQLQQHRRAQAHTLLCKTLKTRLTRVAAASAASAF